MGQNAPPNLGFWKPCEECQAKGLLQVGLWGFRTARLQQLVLRPPAHPQHGWTGFRPPP